MDLGGQQVAQLKALLKWYKEEFFTWCNQPPCKQCGSSGNMVRYGDETPSEEDRENHATRIESYRCLDCMVLTRFPRYNNPVKLFETRTGRCGEWANAFTALCVALGHEARLVHDWTDHLWTEVFVYEYNRWVHLDSCEPLFDLPLTYEKGWGKQLTYVVAISAQEVVDVTRRYVVDPLLNRMRRRKVNEEWLDNFLTTTRLRMWDMQAPAKKEELQARLANELQELSAPGGTEHVVYQARQSGSLEWRQSRAETGEKDVLSMMAGYHDIDKMPGDAAKARKVANPVMAPTSQP